MGATINVDLCIEFYNAKNKKAINSLEMEKLNRVKVARKIWPHITQGRAEQKLCKWANDSSYKVSMEDFTYFLQITQCSADFALGISQQN